MMDGKVSRQSLYGLEDKVPPAHGLLLAAQHAILALVFLVYPLAAAQQIGLSADDTARFLTGCVLAIGLSTCLHYFRPTIGSGSLAVEIPTPIFLPTAVLVGGVGGLATLAGMSIISGLVECIFARALHYLRALFPAEVCGVAVMMLGISVVRPGVLNALGVTPTAMGVHLAPLIVASITVATIAVISIFGSGRVKLMALGVGLLVGIFLSSVLGLLDLAQLRELSDASWLGWPRIHFGVPSFSLSLVPLCIVMGLVLSVDNIGMLVGIQRQIDPNWNKIDVRQTCGGIQVSGIGDLIAGIFGGMPTGISSAHVSLAHATGAIARRISLLTGLLLILAAFAPKVVVALSLVPRPVVGAVMVYAAAYMLVSGMTLILGRMLNERRIFVIGFSVVMGLMPALVPGIYIQVPDLLRPILESPLAVGTFVAIVLTQVFRIGAAQRASLSVELLMTDNEGLREYHINKTIRQTLDSVGTAVGASRAAIDRAIDVTSELMAVLATLRCFNGSVNLLAAFEDTRLKIELAYSGNAVPEISSASILLQSEGSALQRAWRLMDGNIDKVSRSTIGDMQRLKLVFEA
jgi:hypothetical protein